MKSYPQPDSFKKIVDNETNMLSSKKKKNAVKKNVMQIYPQPDSFRKVVNTVETNQKNQSGNQRVLRITQAKERVKELLTLSKKRKALLSQYSKKSKRTRNKLTL